MTTPATDRTSSRASVLVVDDDPAIRKMVCRRLASDGLDTAEAPDGTAALAYLDVHRIDLVLLDIMMPGMDGFDVLREVRSRWDFARLPVIMLSARDQGSDVIAALRDGANDYATKPIDFPLLSQRIRRHLDLGRTDGGTIGGYKIVRRIGGGGMGIVYEAIDGKSDTRVALKVLPRYLTMDETFVARFHREANLARRIHHSSIVQIFDAGVDDETHFIAMELVNGKDLAEIYEEGRLAVDVIVRMARQLAGGLAALEAEGILHRDIKPENVMIDDEGDAKLADFGIARDAQRNTRLTEGGTGIGSITYASPEQLEGRGDQRADIYSLGCTLFFALTGKDPFSRALPTIQVYKEKRRRPPRLNLQEKLPAGLAELVERMMAPSPRRRPSSAAALSCELDAIAAGTVSAVRISAGRVGVVALVLLLALAALAAAALS